MESERDQLPATVDLSDPNSGRDGRWETPARKNLFALRLALLRLHKVLLDMERREYERVHGRASAGELFRLVIDHPQFSWLHNISEFVVRLDEMLEADPPVTPEDAHTMIALAAKIFTPSDNGDGFQKLYYDAIQRDPLVVMEHAELARLFAKEAPDSPTPS